MQGDSWIAQMLIGGVLLVFFFLLIPVFAFNGYLLRVIGTTVDGESEPPAWDDWGELIIDGIKFSIVGLVYSIVPIVAIFGIGSVLLGLGGAAGESGGGIIAGFGLMTILLLIPVMFLVYYIVPAALANMAVEGSLGAAFDFSLLKNVVLTSDYFIAVLMPIVVGIITNLISNILAVTVIGLVLVPFVTYYGQVAVFRMFGTAFASQTNKNAKQVTGPTTSA
ncbi:DUF4013 domain-containing protein [Haloarcula argentinensis]|uniref:DUF4013 domain-containing protein n=1 Tax=Haloarcula argentinensis TaxID=43776 RepID=A0ABU2EZA4_HALAR|nr:DUF4013 domain-containing protein [Haloarcula argentinensis]MDS0253151.1 DUF4013 domain-containing protein [Haloarcula argentinensis]